MDLHSFDSQVDSLETTANSESYDLFTYYHPQYQPECVNYQDYHHGPCIIDEGECLGDSAYYPSTTSFPIGFDSSGYMALSSSSSVEHDKFFAHHTAAIPPAKMSTYSELMPHVVAHKTTASLKQDARVTTKPEACVSPALCQGHADLAECAEFDDELDCPGVPADELYSEDEDEDEEDSHPSPPSSPYSTPSPPPSPSPSSSSSCCEPPSVPGVVRSTRGKNRFSPIEVKPPRARKGKSATKRTSRGSNDDEPKKPRRRREAVSLACFFCRKRKIACRQPPADSPDRTCNQCRSRGMDCEYPVESRRGVRRNPSGGSHKHAD